MLVAMRFRVAEPDGDAFAERARLALQALAERPGYRGGGLGRAFDDPTWWSLSTEWESVGAYRRALGAYEVKLHATPLLAQALDEPSAFEELAAAAPGGPVTTRSSDRAGGAGSGDDAGVAGSGDGGSGDGVGSGELASRP